MKTYSEANYRRVINWREYLDRVINEGVTEQEATIMKSNSSGWVTCACGNLCDLIPRAGYNHESLSVGCPLDEILNHLGCRFYEEVGNIRLFCYPGYNIDKAKDAARQAKEILERIEKRSCAILKEINK